MSKPSLAGNLDARDLQLLLAGESPSAALSQLAVGPLGGRAGNLEYQSDRVEFRDLRSALGSSAPEGASTGWAGADAVLLDFGTFQLRADKLEFPSGIRMSGKREAFAPQARLDNLTVTIADFAAFGSEEDAAGTATAEEAATPRDRPLFGIRDWSFLDAIDGHLNLDLFVDTTVPLLGRRRATHHFRIPVEHGTVDYRGVEDSLHWLEDAFLDIEVIDGKLVLEQDLPLVPFSGKALVWWNLDAKELELARQRRVRLRTLLAPEMPPQAPSKGKKKKPSVVFHQFALRSLDIDLSLRRKAELAIGEAVRVKLGADERPGLVELKLAGDLQYHMRRALEPTSIDASLQRLSAGDTRLDFDAVTISASGVELGPLDQAKMDFQGLQPSSLAARLVGATIRDLRVAF